MKEFQFYKDSDFYKGFELALEHEQKNATKEDIIKDISEFIHPLDASDKDFIVKYDGIERIELNNDWFNYGNRAYNFEVENNNLLLVSSAIVSDNDWDNLKVYAMDSNVINLKNEDFKNYIAEQILLDYKETKGACDYERYSYSKAEISAYEKFLDKYIEEHEKGQYPPCLREFRDLEFSEPESRKYYGLEKYFEASKKCFFNPLIEEWINTDKSFKSLDENGYSISIHEVMSWLKDIFNEYEASSVLKSKDLNDVYVLDAIGDLIVEKCNVLEEKYSLDLLGEILYDDDYDEDDKSVLSVEVTNDLILDRLLYWDLADLIDDPDDKDEVDYDKDDNED